MKSFLLFALAFLCAATGARADTAKRPLLAAGEDAPDFTARKVDGTDFHLSDLRGKVVLVDFWATWCGPCKHAMPHVEALHRKLAAQGLEVVGVCVWDTPEAFRAWQAHPEVRTSYLKVFDPAGKGHPNIARKSYHVQGIPTFYLIDRDGRVLFAGMGASPATERALNRALVAAGFKV